MSRIALVDLETTSLSPATGEIIEIGLLIFDSKTFEIFDTWEQKIRPLDIENADPKALAVNGYDKSEWTEAIDIIPALEIFVEKTKGCIFLAFNASFDAGFLEFNLEKYGFKWPMSYSKMCLMSMCFSRIPHEKVFSWSLKTCATYLGVPREDNKHRAMGGVMCEYGVYKKLMSNATITTPSKIREGVSR